MEPVAPLELDLEFFMREALAEADAAGRAGERPIGAVLVVAGEVVSRGRNREQERRSQLAHAELNALLAGGEPVWSRHEEAAVFTTVEPCPLCLGAVVMADVPHVVFACHDDVAGSRRIVETIPYVSRHIATYLGGVLEREARDLMSRYHASWTDSVVRGGDPPERG